MSSTRPVSVLGVPSKTSSVALPARRRPGLVEVVAATATLLAATLLAGCSGGGSSPTAPKQISEASIAAESFALVNGARKDERLGELEFNAELSRVARLHSEAMRDGNFFGHSGPTSSGLRQRLRGSGVVFTAAAENLALVQHPTSPAGLAHQQLMQSPSHRSNILDDRFGILGVGVARRGDSFWITQIFVAP